MRSKSPELMDRILHTVNDLFDADQRMPSLQKVADTLGIAKSTVHKYLVEMDKRDILSYQDGTILTEKTNKLNFSITQAPLLGGISCGSPEEEHEHVEEYIPLPTELFGNSKDLFILTARGDSMIGAGISTGDYVVIKRQQTARVNDIVVALVDHRENTLKRLLYDKDLGRKYLHPENPAYDDMYFNEIEIQGVLVNVIKNGPFETIKC